LFPYGRYSGGLNVRLWFYIGGWLGGGFLGYVFCLLGFCILPWYEAGYIEEVCGELITIALLIKTILEGKIY